MTEFVTDYSSIITLADVPHAAICEDITKKDGKMWAVAEEVDMSWYNKE